jgi:hypothetical protein
MREERREGSRKRQGKRERVENERGAAAVAKAGCEGRRTREEGVRGNGEGGGEEREEREGR